MTRIFVGTGLWLLSLPVLAATGKAEGGETAAPHLVAEPLAVGNLIQLSLGMLAVLLLIGGLAWLLRRTGRFQSGVSGALRVLGGVSMGTRERVVLLQVGNQQLLLGVAPGRIHTLHVLDEPIVPEQSVAVGGNSGFSEALSLVMGRGKPQ
jgi:flagellar protein FliO/FliZ